MCWNMESENIWRMKNSTFYIQDTKQTFGMHQMHLNGLRDVCIANMSGKIEMHNPFLSCCAYSNASEHLVSGFEQF